MAVSPRWQRITVFAICASAALFVGSSLWQMLGLVAPVLGLFFGGWLLSTILEPIVGRLVRRTRAQRSAAVFAAYVIVLVTSALVWILVSPVVAGQINASVSRFPGQADTAARQVLAAQSAANSWLIQHDVGLQLDLSLASENLAREVSSQFQSSASIPVVVVTGVMGALGSLALMLLLSVFFLVGGPQLAEQVAQQFGNASEDVRFVLAAVHDAFESFVRAQMLQGFLYAAGVWVGLSLAQVDSAPLVSLAAGVLLLVPVVGAALAVLLPVVATLLWHPAAALVVAVVLVLLEQVVLNMVGPRLMSRQLGLPPLLVFFGVLGGGQVGGFWGAVFGTPVLAALLTCVEHFRSRWAD
jgi:predicted PurR-regulated permease PerM